MRIWSPGLADGWVPQGVAVGDGALWVAAYRSTDPKQSRGPCRVFRVDPAHGRVTGQFALPPSCGHAGGVAHGGGRHLYVADGRRLYRIDTEDALAAGECAPQSCATVALAAGLAADALAYREGALWLVSYTRPERGTGHAALVSEQDIVALAAAGAGVLDERAVRRTLAIAPQTQGAAVAADGALWLTQSGGTFGRLQRVDPESGAVTGSWPLPAGVEDIEFAQDGMLWMVSEAGSRRWHAWATFYPVVFALDVSALEPPARTQPPR